MDSIVVSNLGKAYKKYPTKLSRLAEWIMPGHKPRYTLKWVLKDISFTIKSGEAVGVIGINGAGKSTLLKMITGTTQASTGSIKTTGRVAALLELGMGFHPDFTGRQNVFMAGQLLGLTAEHITNLMSEIEAFAEIGDYIDQPVRIYSSGMQVRLAFAVATAVRPDTLIIDEALAVGDASFQRKCFRRIEEFLKLGTTLLFVSHNTEMIKTICSKALYISEGRMKRFDAAKSVCDYYEKVLFGGKSALTPPKQRLTTELVDQSLVSGCEVEYGDGRAVIEDIWMENDIGEKANLLISGENIRVCYDVRVEQSLQSPVLAMMIKTREGLSVFGTDSKHLGQDLGYVQANEVLKAKFELRNSLLPGIYYLNCGLRDKEDVFIHRRVDALIFRVIDGGGVTGATGLAELDAKLIIQ